MNVLFLTVALLGADDRNQAGSARMHATDINGAWQVVYAECHGQPLTAAAATPIMIRNNTITFGPNALRYADQAARQGQPGQPAQPRRQAQPNDPAQQAGEGKSQEEKMAALQNLTKHNWKLEFGADQCVKAQPIAGGIGQPGQVNQAGTAGHQAMAKAGVYIATKDYLALCFHKDAKHGDKQNASARDADRAQPNPAAVGSGQTGQQPMAGEFVVILRRQGGSGQFPGQIPGQVPGQNPNRAQ